MQALHARLRLHSLNQNEKDLASYKDKIAFSLKKVAEVESNLAELKALQLEDDKKYEHLGNIA